MNRKTTRLAALIAPLALALWSAPAAAQQSDRPGEVHHRNECRLAAQALRTGHPHPRYAWARGYISTCGEDGPPVLAAQWRSVPADTGEVRFLVQSSARIRDARIYQEARRTAQDRSRPALVRVGAMLVLGRYVDPHSAVGLDELRPPAGEVRRIPLVSSWSTGGGQLAGTEPQGPAATEVLALLRQVAAARDTEDVSVWYAAAVLARRVEADIRTGRAR